VGSIPTGCAQGPLVEWEDSALSRQRNGIETRMDRMSKMRCFKCGEWTVFKVYFKEAGSTIMRYVCATDIKGLDPEKITITEIK
jgi:hypothetical protein